MKTSWVQMREGSHCLYTALFSAAIAFEVNEITFTLYFVYIVPGV